MKTQDQKIKQIKRYKKTSIVFPIIGGVLLAGGAAAGITIGLMKLPKVTAENGTIEMHAGDSPRGQVKFKFKDSIKDNKVTAKLGNTNSNGQDDEATIVFDSEHQGGTSSLVDLQVEGDVAKLDIMLVNPPQAAGEYSYTYSVTFEYRNSDGKLISHKINNLRVNYSVSDEWLYITEPEASQYERTATLDKDGSTNIVIGKYSYRGELSNVNDLDAILINYDGGQDAPHVVPSIINHNVEEKTFDVQVSITNGHGKDQYDSYLITGNLQFTFKSTTVLEKSQNLHLEITETVNVIEPNEGLITTIQLYNGQVDYPFQFEADLKTTGMYEFRSGLPKASLEITHDFACPKGMSIELEPNNVSERSKNIKIKGNLHFDNEALRLSDYDLHSTLVYRYTNSKSIFTDVYGEKSFIVKIVAQKGIYAPDMSIQPNHIKLMPNDDFTGSTAGNKIRFTGFGFSGYPNLDNVALEGTGDFADLPSENIRFEIDRDSVDPGLRKFDIVGTFDNLSATEWFGRKLTGNFAFKEKNTGDPIPYEPTKDFNIDIQWVDGVEVVSRKHEEDVHISKDGTVTVVYPNAIWYTGFDTNGQKNNLVLKLRDITGLTLIPEKSKINFDPIDPAEGHVYGHASITLNFKVTDPTAVVFNVPIELGDFRIEYVEKPEEAPQSSYPLPHFFMTILEQYDVIDKNVQKQWQQQVVVDPSGQSASTTIKLAGYEFTGFDLKTPQSRNQFMEDIEVETIGSEGITVTKKEIEAFYPEIETDPKTFDFTLEFKVNQELMYKDNEVFVNFKFKVPETDPQEYIKSDGYSFKLLAINSFDDEEVPETVVGQVHKDMTSNVIIPNFTYTGYTEGEGIEDAVIPMFKPSTGAAFECSFDKIDKGNKTFSVLVPFTNIDPFDDSSVAGKIQMVDKTQPSKVIWTSNKTITAELNAVGTVADYDFTSEESYTDREVTAALVEDEEGNTSATFTYTGFRFTGFDEEDRDALTVVATFMLASGGSVDDIAGDITWHEDKTLDVTFTVDLGTSVLPETLTSKNITFVLSAGTSRENILVTGTGDDEATAHYSVNVISEKTIVEPTQKTYSKEYTFGDAELEVTIGSDNDKFLPNFYDPLHDRITVEKTEGTWDDDVSVTIDYDSYDEKGFNVIVTIVSPEVKTYTGKFDFYVDGAKMMTTDRYVITPTLKKEIIVEGVTPTASIDLPYSESGQEAEVEFDDFVTHGLTSEDKNNIVVDTDELEFSHCSGSVLSAVHQFTSADDFKVVIDFTNLSDIQDDAEIAGQIRLFVNGTSVQATKNIQISVNMDSKPTITAPVTGREVSIDIPSRSTPVAYATFEGFATEGFTAEQKQLLCLTAAGGNLSDKIIAEQSDIVWNDNNFKLTLAIDVTECEFGTAYSGTLSFNLKEGEFEEDITTDTESPFSITILDPIPAPEIIDTDDKSHVLMYSDDNTLQATVAGITFVGIDQESSPEFTTDPTGEGIQWLLNGQDITDYVNVDVAQTIWTDQYTGSLEISVKIDTSTLGRIEKDQVITGGFTVSESTGVATPLISTDYEFTTPESPIPAKNFTFDVTHIGKLEKNASGNYEIKVFGYGYSGYQFDDIASKLSFTGDWYVNGIVIESRYVKCVADYHKGGKWSGTFDLTFTFSAPVIIDGVEVTCNNFAVVEKATGEKVGQDSTAYSFIVEAIPQINMETAVFRSQFDATKAGWKITVSGIKTKNLGSDPDLKIETTVRSDTAQADTESIDYTYNDGLINMTFMVYGQVNADHQMKGSFVFIYTDSDRQEHHFVFRNGGESWFDLDGLAEITSRLEPERHFEIANWVQHGDHYESKVTLYGFNFSGYISSIGVVDSHLHCNIIPTVTEEGISADIIYLIQDEATLTGNNNISFTLGVSKAEFDHLHDEEGYSSINGQISLSFYYEFKWGLGAISEHYDLSEFNYGSIYYYQIDPSI